MVLELGSESRVVAVGETAAGSVINAEGERILVTHRGDFDLDGDVDQGDLQIFLLYYGLPAERNELRGNSGRYDLDSSGRVDAADWTILRREHGATRIEIPPEARVAGEVP